MPQFRSPFKYSSARLHQVLPLTREWVSASKRGNKREMKHKDPFAASWTVPVLPIFNWGIE